MSKTMKKRIVLAIILIVIAICTLPLRITVDKKINAIQWKKGDKEYSEKVEINIRGTYKRYLFRQDRFTGHLEIDNYEITKTSKEITLYSIAKYGCSMLYFNERNESVRLGKIIFDPYFSKLFIEIVEPEHNGNITTNDMVFISGPAENREEGIKLVPSDYFFYNDLKE